MNVADVMSGQKTSIKKNRHVFTIIFNKSIKFNLNLRNFLKKFFKKFLNTYLIFYNVNKMVVGYINHEAVNQRELSAYEYSEAGLLSGIVTRALIQPLDVLKIRFQVV